MSDNQPTAETVLFSRHRAARRIDRDDLIQAADKALEASSHREFHILAPPRTANAVVKAIWLLSDSWRVTLPAATEHCPSVPPRGV
jgi:hypothetical protein